MSKRKRFPRPGSRLWDSVTTRRSELIYRTVLGYADLDEATELEFLQFNCSAVLEALYPEPLCVELPQ